MVTALMATTFEQHIRSVCILEFKVINHEPRSHNPEAKSNQPSNMQDIIDLKNPHRTIRVGVILLSSSVQVNSICEQD